MTQLERIAWNDAVEMAHLCIMSSLIEEQRKIRDNDEMDNNIRSLIQMKINRLKRALSIINQVEELPNEKVSTDKQVETIIRIRKQ